MSEPRALPMAAALADEDQARRDWYLLLGRLFAAPPDAATLAAVAAAAPAGHPGSEAPPFLQAVAGLAEACAQAEPAAVAQEYDAAFIGVGKSEIFLYASWYLSGFLHDRPLVAVRERLAELGLAGRADIGQTEDHFAALCETMAILIGSADPRLSSLGTQRDFFSRFLAPCFEPLCDAIEHSGLTDFYKHVARLARVFLSIERQAFDFE